MQTYTSIQKKVIYYLARKNGYNNKIIDKLIKKITKRKTNINQRKEQNIENKYISVPYNITLNKAVRKTFEKTKFNLSYESNNNAFNIISKKTNLENNKEEEKYNQSGIYKLKCSDCKDFYIGQTGRTFKSRFHEHIQALKSNNRTSMKSNFAEHLLKTNHTYKGIKNNLEIIEVLNKGNKMDSKEELHIYIEQKNNPRNLLNSHIAGKNPIFEKIKQIIDHRKIRLGTN